MCMTPSKPIILRVSTRLRERLERECDRRKCELSELVRSLLADALGDPSLAEMRPPRRPRKDELESPPGGRADHDD